MEIAIADRLKDINAQIVPYNPKIIAVTKYFDETAITKYFEAGLRDFGENRVVDALNKISKLPENIRNNSRFHLIGHLQTNKVKLAVGNFDLIHSVDSVKLAEAISKEAAEHGITQKVLVQVNIAKEESKYGFTKEDVLDCFGQLLLLPSVKIEGLMNIAPLSQDEKYLRFLFGEMKQLKDRLSLEHKVQLKELSMGMSNDFRIAAEEGSTMIRLGRILFQKI